MEKGAGCQSRIEITKVSDFCPSCRISSPKVSDLAQKRHVFRSKMSRFSTGLGKEHPWHHADRNFRCPRASRAASLGKILQLPLQLVPGSSKRLETLFIRVAGKGRVVDAPVDAFHVPGKDRAVFAGVVADGDDIVEVLSGEDVLRLGVLTAYVHANFSHCLDGLRPNVGFECPGAEDLETVPGNVPQKPFSHLTPGRIAGAQDQDSFAVIHNLEQTAK
jgi:hypothetical protein